MKWWRNEAFVLHGRVPGGGEGWEQIQTRALGVSQSAHWRLFGTVCTSVSLFRSFLGIFSSHRSRRCFNLLVLSHQNVVQWGVLRFNCALRVSLGFTIVSFLLGQVLGCHNGLWEIESWGFLPSKMKVLNSFSSPGKALLSCSLSLLLSLVSFLTVSPFCGDAGGIRAARCDRDADSRLDVSSGTGMFSALLFLRFLAVAVLWADTSDTSAAVCWCLLWQESIWSLSVFYKEFSPFLRCECPAVRCRHRAVAVILSPDPRRCKILCSFLLWS